MSNDNLIWLDLEMTGLNIERDRILEIATLITDSRLNILAEGPVLAINQSELKLSLMDAWNTHTHGVNGLLEKVRCSTVNECVASTLTIDFLRYWVPCKCSPICGNSIMQDRRFLLKYMPDLEMYFSHRCIDVSTIKELAIRWRPDLLSGLKLQKMHRALEDIRDSVAELVYYRDNFIQFM